MTKNVLMVACGLVCIATASRAVDEWKVSSGGSVLYQDTKWSSRDALANLDHLLTSAQTDEFKLAAGADRYYIVIVATNSWTEIFLLQPSDVDRIAGPGTASSNGNAAPQSARIHSSRNVTIVGIRNRSTSLRWSWEVTPRDRLHYRDFLSFIAPTLIGAAAVDTASYFVRTEDVDIRELPSTLKVEAEAVTFERDSPKNSGTDSEAEPGVGHPVRKASEPSPSQDDKSTLSIAKSFENYGDEFISFGVGIGVRDVDDVAIDIEDGTLHESESSKLKSYGLINVHYPRVDPHQLATWTWPYLSVGIEINTKVFNYALGVGWHVPYLADTAIGLLAVHAQPELTDDAKGAGAQSDRQWKWAAVIEYTFPKPSKSKSTEGEDGE